MTRLHLDYETASEVNIKSAGAYKYAADPSTKILMLGWAFDDEAPQLWQPRHNAMPAILREGLLDPAVSKKAFNAAFERLITRHCAGIEIPTSSMTCTMVESYYLGFAGGLDAILKAVGLEPKDDRGKRLINLFCTPAPKNHKAAWYDEDNRPAEWDEFCQYCLQDVSVERQLWHWMQKYPTMSEWDHKQWQLDQRINDRGVLVDTSMAKSAIEVWDRERELLTETLREMTGLQTVTRGPFLKWMEEHTGDTLDSLRKDYLATLLHKEELPPEARPYIEIWAQKEAKATSKYSAIINAANPDGRARGMFQYKGASRTDRVGGRLIQLQNLKRPFVSQAGIDPLVGAIKCGDPEFLRMLYPQSVSATLGGAIRHAIAAPEGKCFAISDYTSVESVVLGWVAMCPEIDRTFRAGRDSYKTFASIYFETDYDNVTKAQRSFSKPPVLGCFAADTKVLTKRGWVDIALILDQDELWDGVEWVTHDGVIPQGEKEVISQHGVRATPDHEILTADGWVEWKDLAGGDIKRATAWESGALSSTWTHAGGTYAGARAGSSERSSRGFCPEEGQARVSYALTADSPLRALPRQHWESPNVTMIDWPTDSTLRGLGARTPAVVLGDTTEVEGSVSGSIAQRSTSNTSSPSTGGTTPLQKSIDATMIEDMLKETSGSPLEAGTLATPVSTRGSCTRGLTTPLPPSDGSSAQHTRTDAQSCGKSATELMQKTSSRSTVPTFDVLNCGPRNRFTVLTDKGPVIAHNCGFMLGWKGLIAYAEGYGVDMVPDEAKRAVNTFREMYPEIPAFWKWIYDAVKYVTQSWQPCTGYRITVERDADFLRIWLPSGRALSYYKPDVIRKEAPWSTPEKVAMVDNFCCMGMNDKNQWVRIFAHAGGITENIVQSIAGDLLWNGITNADAAGLDVVVHVHDEIAVECDIMHGPVALSTLEECMTRAPAWADGMWIGADGFLTRRYTKI